MDLDDELRELFSSDRLDVSVRRDAEQIIVTGARRVRRRRIAAATASGVLAVVTVVAAGVVLAGGNPESMPPATTNPTTPPAAGTSSPDVMSMRPGASSMVAQPPSPGGTTAPPPPRTTTKKTTTTTTTEPGPPSLSYQVVGPTGLRALKLGQTLEEAQATGLLGQVTQEAEGGCAAYSLLLDDRVSGFAYVSDTVQAIVADPVETAEGVGPGWTVAQVKAEYPALDEDAATAGRALVPVPGNAAANYRLDFDDAGVVTSVALLADGQTCVA
jgi:hypothetical protein